MLQRTCFKSPSKLVFGEYDLIIYGSHQKEIKNFLEFLIDLASIPEHIFIIKKPQPPEFERLRLLTADDRN